MQDPWVAKTRSRSQGHAAEVSKRGLDLAVSGLGLAVLSPFLAAIALAAARVQGRPILFKQQRPGLGGRPFTIIKFRTMRPLALGETTHGSDAQRVTRFGRFLRSTSLDELPELWNVLRGDMSLVGPRPLLMEYLDNYTREEARRHEVRPGVTGWAAVNGRHTTPFEERLQMDVWYVDNRSLWLDVRIIASTVVQVLGRRDVSEVQHADEIQIPARFRS